MITLTNFLFVFTVHLPWSNVPFIPGTGAFPTLTFHGISICWCIENASESFDYDLERVKPRCIYRRGAMTAIHQLPEKKNFVRSIIYPRMESVPSIRLNRFLFGKYIHNLLESLKLLQIKYVRCNYSTL